MWAIIAVEFVLGILLWQNQSSELLPKPLEVIDAFPKLLKQDLIYHLTRLTLIRLKKNGRRLKLFADKKDVLLMSFSRRTFNNHFIGC